ncbi:TetR/AcrR family transcriptional regulator [Desulfuribacillus alkaliarsenatis]|uniref:HTH tetR-type domain-containing protein n=1 Tax=Desulfuribacillus alkaliarsenatis TaxID=766136 RepID=A0A1E5FYR1_9FIRM|nr:TetR/AcrR family transcriptional regulator [Desulfuribacillus alkaliarsenatis]OEF95712.1 hypothetical protein BHF68_11435 [Desulfuribacillus alkaliarsenatis]
MARKKTNQLEIFQATEQLLIRYGYHSFQFKLLADQLEIGRSTLYEYYRNKEELITDYMCHLMQKIISDCESVSKSDNSIEQLKGFVSIFMKYAHIHQILQITHFINPKQSKSIEANINSIKSGHATLNRLLVTVIKKGQAENLLQDDIDVTVIIGVIFNTITIPNMTRMDTNTWIETIFEVVINGIGGKQK